jgi:hypothetical protein
MKYRPDSKTNTLIRGILLLVCVVQYLRGQLFVVLLMRISTSFVDAVWQEDKRVLPT